MRTVRALGLATALTVAHGWACFIIYPSVSVGPNFQVKVEDRGHPVQGLHVVVRDGHARIRATTDKNGLANFRNLRPGAYQVGVNLDAGVPDGADLEVRSDGPANVTVPLRWPSIPPVFARSMKGILHAGDYLAGPNAPPPASVSLDLLDALSGRVLASGHTNAAGEFSFEGIGSGRYFLKLKQSDDWGETGLIALGIDPAAPAERFDLDLGGTDCGLSYTDRNQCPQGDLHVAQLRGRVVDPEGAVIANADILLFDLSDKLVEKIRTDRNGDFASANAVAGTYYLVAKAPGFSVSRSTVYVGSANGTESRTTKIQLGIVGSCSAAMQ
jgi:hypothetical protein